jgi:hypothetical protein
MKSYYGNKEEMGRSNRHGGDDKCVQNFAWKTEMEAQLPGYGMRLESYCNVASESRII